MTRKKPLPYAAGGLIDKAVMECSEGIRALAPMLNGREMSSAEVIRRAGLAIHCMHEAITTIRDIPILVQDELDKGDHHVSESNQEPE